MISKAADSVPVDPVSSLSIFSRLVWYSVKHTDYPFYHKQQKELLSPPRAIQNTEELFLLIEIFEFQDRHSEIVKVLNSQNLGISSRIVQNEWSAIRAKLLSLEKAQLWSEGLAYTRELLTLPSNESERKALQERDDWTVWNLMVTATRNIDKEE